MAKRGMLPLLMLGAGALVIASGKKAKAEPKPSPPPPDVGPEFPGGVTDQPLPPAPQVFVVPNEIQVDAPHIIRAGDIPSIMAFYYTGDGLRFKELGTRNPNLGQLKTIGGVSNYEGWKVGTKIFLPGNWKPYSKPLPKAPTSATSPKPTDPPVFPPAPEVAP